MKILFVVKSKQIETLGPMYLSSIAKQAGYECRIVDINEALDIALSCLPDIIGYSVLTGNQGQFITLNENLKRTFSFISIVGGPHATFFPSDFEDNEHIDYVVRGEAENWMAKFLHFHKRYPDLDLIPWPDRTDFPDHKIRDFIASRGCVYGNCTYCYNKKWAELSPGVPKVRYRSVDNVVEEILSVKPEFVYFQDSCFGTSMGWLEKFSEQYKSKAQIPFHCHLRPSQATKERIQLLKGAGCVSVRIALETASDKLRRVIGRPHTSNAETIKAAALLKKWGIKLMIQNMIGIGSSTIEEDLQTLEVNLMCQPDYGWCSIYQPYPGTVLGDECKKRGWYSGNFSEISDCFFDTTTLNFPPEHVEQLECLQKIFAFCVEMQAVPEIDDLTRERLPKFIHSAMRKVGDKRMFPGIL